MQEPLEPSIRTRLIFLGIGLLLVVPLGFLFGTLTYEGISVYQARAGVPSGLDSSSAVVEDSWTITGISRGGDGGGGTSYSVHGATLRVAGQERPQTFDDLPHQVALERYETVDVSLWHGQIVEIESIRVAPGWASGTRIMAILALYPLLLIGALTVLTQLGMLLLRLFRSGPPHPEYERGTSFRSLLWGTVTGYVLAVAASAVIAFREEDLFWWPPVSFGVALIVAIFVFIKRNRRLRRRSAPAE